MSFLVNGPSFLRNLCRTCYVSRKPEKLSPIDLDARFREHDQKIPRLLSSLNDSPLAIETLYNSNT